MTITTKTDPPPPTGAKLSVSCGPDLGAEFDLDTEFTSRTVTVGRDEHADITLNDPAVSREHFRLEKASRAWRVVDLGSRNQTFLNGRPVSDIELAGGDVLRVGDTELRFQDSERLGGGSTIMKHVQQPTGRETFLERIDHVERMLEEEKAKRALDEVRRLFEVHQRLATTASSDELFHRILAEVVPVLKADSAVVVVNQGGDWKVRAKYPDESSEKVSFSRSVVQRVADSGEALLLERAEDEEELRKKQSIVSQDITTILALPLRTGGAVRAVIYTDRRGSDQPFLDSDLELLTAALDSVAPFVGRLLEGEKLKVENRHLFESIASDKKIIGRSPAIEAVLSFIRRAAPTPMTVLIQGETGTGKELVAAAIHYASPRRGQPFVALNCAAMPEQLAESELFGHEKGSFTGAASRRKGRFELAHGGTIFLDEVGELSPACQAKLLRLLEERCFERVGGAESIEVDVRVVAATNRDLLGAVDEGEFREDLYYRLNVLSVELPPLRQRSEDIPLLVEHFLAMSHAQHKSLSKRAEEALRSYNWPGNIRELRNVIESAVVLGTGNVIKPEDLLLTRSRPRKAQATAAWEPISLQQLEKSHIARVLEHTGGNKKRAAEILGIERCTLYAKIKNYDLNDAT